MVDQFDIYFKISGTPINEHCSTLKTRRCLSFRDDPTTRMHAAVEWIQNIIFLASSMLELIQTILIYMVLFLCWYWISRWMKWFNGAFTRSRKNFSKVWYSMVYQTELRGFVVFFLYASFKVNMVFKLHFIHLRWSFVCIMLAYSSQVEFRCLKFVVLASTLLSHRLQNTKKSLIASKNALIALTHIINYINNH